MSSLPTPPNEGDGKHHSSSRRSTGKSIGKSSSRSSKRTTSSTTSHDHPGVIMDGRHKRVWKACERCRMKKTKCDGESPCKRCKDDGLVCTAGSRKKTEFKQLPRGYAEVLENTQYALIATVQKLYAMVRNGESWELGEPEMNDRGQPVIHNIAEKLGCIRPSPDLPYAFPEDAEEFAELQAQMKLEAEDSAHKSSDESVFSHPPRDHRASSTESDHSDLSKDYNQMMWSAQQKLRQQQNLASEEQFTPDQQMEPQFGQTPMYATEFKQEPSSLAASGAFGMRADLSPVYTDFQAQSPMFRSDSPFSPWSGNDDFMGQGNMMDATAMYLRQQQLQAQAAFQQRPMATPRMATGTINPVTMAPNTFMAGSDGTIRPGMLDGSAVGYMANQVDNMMFANFEAQELRMS